MPNQAPTSITLDASSVVENYNGVHIANISGFDPDGDDLTYSVCALGDSSHSIFCGAGKKVDEKLIQLGAKKIVDRQDCDGSDEGSEAWSNSFLKKISA